LKINYNYRKMYVYVHTHTHTHKNAILKESEMMPDDYFVTLEKYKHLQKEWVSKIPDSELENAVMSWMWTKCSGSDEDWDNQLETISSLPKPCQDVYSTRTVIDEVNNGGLNQLFFNSTGQFTLMAIDGFLAMGSPKLSSTLEKAVVLYAQNRDVLENYYDGTIEGFFASYEEKIFDKLEEGIFAAFKDIDFVKYIRSNADCFGY